MTEQTTRCTVENGAGARCELTAGHEGTHRGVSISGWSKGRRIQWSVITRRHLAELDRRFDD